MKRATAGTECGSGGVGLSAAAATAASCVAAAVAWSLARGLDVARLVDPAGRRPPKRRRGAAPPWPLPATARPAAATGWPRARSRRRRGGESRIDFGYQGRETSALCLQRCGEAGGRAGAPGLGLAAARRGVGGLDDTCPHTPAATKPARCPRMITRARVRASPAGAPRTARPRAAHAPPAPAPAAAPPAPSPVPPPRRAAAATRPCAPWRPARRPSGPRPARRPTATARAGSETRAERAADPCRAGSEDSPRNSD